MIGADADPTEVMNFLAKSCTCRKLVPGQLSVLFYTQGKIERWHQTLKNRILLENYFLPGDLEAQIGAFVEHYNRQSARRLDWKSSEADWRQSVRVWASSNPLHPL